MRTTTPRQRADVVTRPTPGEEVTAPPALPCAATPRQGPAAGDPALAWRTLAVTTYALTLGSVTWFVVSAVAVHLPAAGFALSTAQLYWLTAAPGLAGGVLRLVWTFLPPILGTRRLVTWSTALLLVPLAGWAVALPHPGTPYPVLVLLATLAGIGGGVFSGFMPSTSYFFPRDRQGTALAIQAGVGNMGVGLVQAATPALIGFSLLGSMLGGPQRDPGDGTAGDVWLQNAALFWIPFVLAGAAVAWVALRDVPVRATGVREQLDIFRHGHTWAMTYLYLLTLGTFSGLAAVFALLIESEFGSFPDPPDPLAYAFLGALVGSLTRILAGPLTDRVGGGLVTALAALGIAGSAGYCALIGLRPAGSEDFDRFLWGMLAVFFFAGVGNASTFQQMAVMFPPRQAGSVLGWTAAVAAFGPFIAGIGLSLVPAVTFFWSLAAWAGAGALLAWTLYVRPPGGRRRRATRVGAAAPGGLPGGGTGRAHGGGA